MKAPVQTKLLIDAIVRQTTVLIAQLSSSAGLRAPLSHIADEVFLQLSEELEGHGLSRKVVADMFGMALRGYQRRVQRLRESSTQSGRTLWEALLDHLQESGPTNRLRILERFGSDDPTAVAAILNDLVGTGLATRTGSGPAAVFAVTPEELRHLLAQEGHQPMADALVWLELCRHPGAELNAISARLGMAPTLVQAAIERLQAEGTVQGTKGDSLRATSLIIPVGAEQGWETAVFDHYQAVCAAIASKLHDGANRSSQDDTTGGMTLSFEISDTHPLKERVLGLLRTTRERADALWDEVEELNARSPIPEEQVHRVSFYFGQSVRAEDPL